MGEAVQQRRFADGFGGHVAVVTGGGSGMGRELVRQLAAAGCDVATCDVLDGQLAETAALCAGSPGEVLTMRADVSDEAQVGAFRDRVAAWRPHVNLLFNNAGIGGGGGFVNGDRQAWERTFDICWGGVYLCTRAFLPAMLAAPVAHLVNTSSVNGFWASLGPATPHTAYSAAKFAVKGFSEALITDLRLNAPHVHVSVVMPGHIGTEIALNSARVHSGDGSVDPLVRQLGEAFRDNAPMDAAEAATIILDAVRRDEWRILVGEDAKRLDARVRSDPWSVYDEGYSGLWSDGSA